MLFIDISHATHTHAHTHIHTHTHSYIRKHTHNIHTQPTQALITNIYITQLHTNTSKYTHTRTLTYTNTIHHFWIQKDEFNSSFCYALKCPL